MLCESAAPLKHKVCFSFLNVLVFLVTKEENNVTIDMFHRVLLKSDFFFLKNISSGYFGWCKNRLVVCVKSLYIFLGILNMCIDNFFFIDNTGPNSPIFLIKKYTVILMFQTDWTNRKKLHAIGQKTDFNRCASVPIMWILIPIGSVINLRKNRTDQTAHTPNFNSCDVGIVNLCCHVYTKAFFLSVYMVLTCFLNGYDLGTMHKTH